MKHTSTIITIVSGKGGVGKSVVSVNLAETLADNGYRVALVDADFGQGACALLLNELPQAGAVELAMHTAQAEDVLHTTASGITLVQGAADPRRAEGRAPALYRTLDELLRQLRTTHEFILIDAPAGTGEPVRWALDRADLGLLTLVGEPTAIADAYRLAKMIWHAAPEYPMGVVVNFADTEHEAQSVAHRFAKITERFVHRAPSYLGWVPYAAQVRRSVAEQLPAVRTPGPVRDAFVHLADVLVRGRTPVGAAEDAV